MTQTIITLYLANYLLQDKDTTTFSPNHDKSFGRITDKKLVLPFPPFLVVDSFR